jgi:hypothetical protein
MILFCAETILLLYGTIQYTGTETEVIIFKFTVFFLEIAESVRIFRSCENPNGTQNRANRAILSN